MIVIGNASECFHATIAQQSNVKRSKCTLPMYVVILQISEQQMYIL